MPAPARGGLVLESSPIRILYVTVKGLRFTSSQQLGLYVRRFSQGRFRCAVATYKRLDEAERLAGLGVPAHRVKGLRAWTRWEAIWRRPATLRALARIVRDDGIDVIHSFQTSSAPYAMALTRRTGVPHIVQVRNTYDDAGHYLRFGLHRAAVLLMLSDSMMEQFVRLAGDRARPDQRRVVIPNGIDVEAYGDRGRARDVRAELGVEAERPVVGIVGTLSSRKDSLLGLEVARRVVDALPDALFLFVGGYANEGYRREVEERMRSLALDSNCLMVGHQADAAPWFRAMDLLLHTAWREGHAKVFNEAMAFGKPIVASRITGSVDVIEDGVNGLLCAPGDAVAFADAVLELLRSPERMSSMGRAGRLRVEERFSSERSLERLAALYEEVAGSARRGQG